jgi:hypothetical protein
MHSQMRAVYGKDVAGPHGWRHAHRQAWPASPPAQPRHGMGRTLAVR